MDLQKIILFYGFAPVADPVALRLWQKSLCESLGLKGRIIISKHGINGTLGGNMLDLKQYASRTREFPGFSKIDYKWANAEGTEFPKLSVKNRNELVAFRAPDEVQVDVTGVTNGGKHLAPREVNALVAERGDEVVFFDGRNAFEAQIGRFKNAIVPDVETSYDFIVELDSGKYDHLKDKPIVTYCTGGVRCEVLSAVMINRGFKEVYQMAGGVVRYGEAFKDKGLWEGSLYVFDERQTHNFSKDAKVLGVCEGCGGATNSLRDCTGPGCKDMVLVCDTCHADPAHSEHKDSHTRGKRNRELIG